MSLSIRGKAGFSSASLTVKAALLNAERLLTLFPPEENARPTRAMLVDY
jgi:hypothetical protein